MAKVELRKGHSCWNEARPVCSLRQVSIQASKKAESCMSEEPLYRGSRVLITNNRVVTGEYTCSVHAISSVSTSVEADTDTGCMMTIGAVIFWIVGIVIVFW